MILSYLSKASHLYVCTHGVVHVNVTMSVISVHTSIKRSIVSLHVNLFPARKNWCKPHQYYMKTSHLYFLNDGRLLKRWEIIIIQCHTRVFCIDFTKGLHVYTYPGSFRVGTNVEHLRCRKVLLI